MTESMILRVEAAIAEAVIETGDKEFASKLGLFLADHPGLIGRAAIEAMRNPPERGGGLRVTNSRRQETPPTPPRRRGRGD